MPYPTDRPATWYVTGASRGLGLHLVTALLSAGENVVATTRSTDRLLAALGDADRTNLLPLEVQLTDPADVNKSVAAATDRFGAIDVVVNNAGYGYLGAVEEATDDDVRRMFDVQVNGTWNVLRAVLPGMRAAQSGHIINVSSILGLISFPGWGLYCAAKYAVEGLSESLAAEVADHGIRVTIAEPGYFDTDFLTSNSLALPDVTTDAYPAIRDMVTTHQAMPGSQLGDPAKAAAAFLDIANQTGGPLRQQLGSDSPDSPPRRSRRFAPTSPRAAKWPRRPIRPAEQRRGDRWVPVPSSTVQRGTGARIRDGGIETTTVGSLDRGSS